MGRNGRRAPASSPASDALRMLRAQVDDLQAELDDLVLSSSSVPPDDEHDAEGATIGFERARIAALLLHAQSRSAAIEATSGRRASDRSDQCSACGAIIGEERLAARPETTLCVQCASAPTAPQHVGGIGRTRVSAPSRPPVRRS